MRWSGYKRSKGVPYLSGIKKDTREESGQLTYVDGREHPNLAGIKKDTQE